MECLGSQNHHPSNSLKKINSPWASSVFLFFFFNMSRADKQAGEVNANSLFRLFGYIYPPLFSLSSLPWAKDWSVVFQTQQHEMLVS